MIARLGYLWGIDIKTQLGGAAALEMFMSALGKSVAGNILKFIPGLDLVGMMINGTVGAALSYGLGMACNEVCYRVCKSKFEVRPIALNEAFNAEVIESLMESFSQKYHNGDKELPKGTE